MSNRNIFVSKPVCLTLQRKKKKKKREKREETKYIKIRDIYFNRCNKRYFFSRGGGEGGGGRRVSWIYTTLLNCEQEPTDRAINGSGIMGGVTTI